MATWSALRSHLATVENQLTLSWAELDALVGGLPPSANHHRAFWAGDRSMWKGFRTTDLRMNHQVTFVRQGEVARTPPRTGGSSRAGIEQPPRLPGEPASEADLILIGCVKSKLGHPAPAKDLYTSALFRKERAYVESTGKPWFILSAKHGLVAPDEVIEPYDVYLKATPDTYRAWWGRTVVHQLLNASGSVDGKRVEIHASAAYVDQILPRLTIEGARVVAPLDGLTRGQRLAWYSGTVRERPEDAVRDAARPTWQVQPPAAVAQVVEWLGHAEGALTPKEFVATAGMGLRQPGMYSWWVDPAGAIMLSTGLGHRIEPGLIYAGLAGATHTRSGQTSSNTLWGRINSMHLGGRHEFSTFRRTLGSILAHEFLWQQIDEVALTAWMYEHLKVVAVPVADADTLDDLETTVLTELDPPLNLMKMPKTLVRRRLSELRRQFAGSVRNP
jgi:hypothetical protein